MTSLLFSAFLKEVLLARGSLHGKWENKKFRFMYLLRCILNPVASVQYYYKLLSLQSIDKLLEIHPTLPAKIHRPYLHKGGCAHTRGEYIIGHYRFVQSLPHKYQTFLFPCETVSLIQFAGKNGEHFDIQCSPCNFDREGELMLSLYFNKIPVARLSCSIIRTKNDRCAFIGGLQGAPKILARKLFGMPLKPVMGYFRSELFLRFFVR